MWSILVAISATFALIRWMPGNAMDYMLGQMFQQNVPITEARLEAMVRVANLAPNRPLHEQYYIYMSNVLTGDLGESIFYGVPVEDLLYDAMPWTIMLALLSLVFMTSIGLVLGAIVAYYEGSRLDAGVSIYSILATSTPYYVVALMLIAIVGFQLELLPTSGRVSGEVTPSQPIDFSISVLRHATLPVLSLVITGIGGWALNMRGNAISVMGEDYIRVARLRGLTERRIALWYVGRNAILPLYTRLLIGLGTIFGGAVVLETVFNYRGVGFYLFKAISARDIPLMMGAFLFITVGMMISVYVADLTYGLIDPRADVGEGS